MVYFVYRLACERNAKRYADKPLDGAELVLADDPEVWTVSPSW